jgi:two-component system, sensor histidine kinase and response regulator
VDDAFRHQDAPRLREAAHKLCGLLSAFSTLGGRLASDLEDLAACGQLDQARTLVDQVETIAQDLIRQVASLSIEALHRQARTTDGPGRADGA